MKINISLFQILRLLVICNFLTIFLHCQNASTQAAYSGSGAISTTPLPPDGPSSSPPSDPNQTPYPGSPSYTSVKCPPVEERKTKNTFCYEIYKPVCGYFYTCTSSTLTEGCFKEYPNDCNACNDLNVSYYETRKCSDAQVGGTGTGITDPAPGTVVNSTLCQDSDRTVNGCPKNIDTVCGYKEVCDNDGCSKKFDNGCFACLEKDIVMYISGECPPEIPLTPAMKFANRIACDKTSRPSDCSKINYIKAPTPVCAFKSNCDYNREICFVNKNNECEACMDEEIIEYTEDYCPKPTECTSDQRNASCDSDYQGVCSVKADCNSKSTDFCLETTGTECQACSDSKVKEVYPYDCSLFIPFYLLRDSNYIPIGKPAINQKITYCDGVGRNQICTLEYVGVCGHKADACESDCEMTSATVCTACSNKEIVYVTMGECESLQELEYLAYDAAQAPTNTGENNNFLYNNKGLAPAVNNQMTVKTTSYSAKRCTDDDRKASCSTSTNPVCAYKSCTSGYCPLEVANSCTACLDFKVEYYVATSCTNIGFSRVDIPCDNKERLANCTSSSSIVLNRNVCGIYGNNNNSTLCLSSPNCEKDFTSNCNACGNANIISYYEGDCHSTYTYLNLIPYIGILLTFFF